MELKRNSRLIAYWLYQVAYALGSGWVGIILLAWIVGYLAFVSLWTFFDPLGAEFIFRRRILSPFGQTLEPYTHPWLVMPVMLLVVNLVFATITRVRLKLANLGTWVAHVGVIVLLVGGAWYTAGHEDGYAVSFHMADGWSPVTHFYSKDSAAVYICDAAGTERYLPLPKMPFRSTKLDIPVPDMPDGVQLRIVRYLPRAELLSEWSDDGWADIPGVRLEIVDGGLPHPLVLQAVEGEDRFNGDDYTVVFLPHTTSATLAKYMAAPWPIATHLVMLLIGEKIAPTMLIFHPGQTPLSRPVVVNQSVQLKLADKPITLVVRGFMARTARHTFCRTAERVADCPATIGVSVDAGGRERTEWVAYSVLPFQGDEIRTVHLPNGHMLYISFAPQRKMLPQAIDLCDARYETYAASSVPKDYVCDVLLGDAAIPGTIRQNRPLRVGDYDVSQSRWLPTPENPQAIFFNVTSKPGLVVVWAGMIMIGLALPWAFYVKPLLKRRQKGAVG